MPRVKFTKAELRNQQVKLERLRKYLPTLQLKKALLQVEVFQAVAEIEKRSLEFSETLGVLGQYASLFTDRNAPDFFSAVRVQEVVRQSENIAGIDVPVFEKVLFSPPSYPLFDTPIWFESAITGLQDLLRIREKIRVGEEVKVLLEKELRDVSIRVNLFEKILIPRSLQNIKEIKIFLGDQQLAAVSQAKVAKKILSRAGAL